MAWETFDKCLKAVSLEQFGRDVGLRRGTEAGANITRNSGTRRTVSKQALLKGIAATGARW